MLVSDFLSFLKWQFLQSMVIAGLDIVSKILRHTPSFISKNKCQKYLITFTTSWMWVTFLTFLNAFWIRSLKYFGMILILCSYEERHKDMDTLFISGTTTEIIRPTRKLSKLCTSFSEKLCLIKPSKWEKIFWSLH